MTDARTPTNRLSWEEKLSALQNLCECHLVMRKPGDWYVSAHMEIKDECVLVGSYGNGKTPQEAVEDHWRIYTTEATPLKPIVTNAMNDRRKHWFWGGFMWIEVPQEKAA